MLRFWKQVKKFAVLIPIIASFASVAAYVGVSVVNQDKTGTGIVEIPDEDFFELDPFEDVNFDKNEMYSYIRIEGDELVFNDELKAALTKSFLSKINKTFIDVGEDSLQFAFEMTSHNTALLSAKVLVNGFWKTKTVEARIYHS